MNYSKEEIDQVKSYLKVYLEETGRKTRALNECINPEHDDSTPSMSFNRKDNTFKCFGCGVSYDIISLYAFDNNLDYKKDFKDIMKTLIEKYNIDLEVKPTLSKEEAKKKEDFTSYYDKCKKNKSDYLINRGISEKLIDKYSIGYDKDKELIILPCSKYYYEARTIKKDSKFRYQKPKGATLELFNSKNIDDSYKTILFITESIIDALSLEEVNEDIKTIALNSVSNWHLLKAQLKDFKGYLVLALDTDEAGLKASKEIKEDFKNIKTYIMNRESLSYGEGIKDINDYLLADKERLTKNVNYIKETLENVIDQEAQEILNKDSALTFLNDFNEITKQAVKYKPISTNIDILDKVLGGGFYQKQLVILGAISSLGKTTLCLQVADNIAKQGQDVLIFSLEMSKEELIAKALSREMYIESRKNGAYMDYNLLSTMQILRGDLYNENKEQIAHETTQSLYLKAQENYKEFANHVYISELSSENEITIKTIEERIKKQIEITGRKPFVVVDYMQIIQRDDGGKTDKQIADSIVINLKRMARNYNITILVISALNRASYTKEVSLDSFRDTSAIEYTADVLIGMQSSVIDNAQTDDNQQRKNSKRINIAQKKEEREITIKVLKNRNGMIQDINQINFIAKYNMFDFTNAEIRNR